MNNKGDDTKNPKRAHRSVLEAFRELGGQTGTSFKKDLAQGMSRDLSAQLFGRRTEKNYSGEIMPGEALELRDVYTGKRESDEKLHAKLVKETALRRELEKREVNRKQELQLELQAIKDEMVSLASAVGDLSREMDIAVVQAAVSNEVSAYEKFFLLNILSFLKSFVIQIEQAQVWLNASNKRTSKKNKWGQNYKKHGAKYLLSGEHYASRSAS